MAHRDAVGARDVVRACATVLQWHYVAAPLNHCPSLHELRLTAVPRSMPEVVINGRPLPRIDPRGAVAWTYDSVRNAIRFEWRFVPEPGDVVTVRYLPVCAAQ